MTIFPVTYSMCPTTLSVAMNGNTRSTVLLELTEKQKETVKRVQRSLSVEILDRGDGNGRRTEYVTRVSEEEAEVLSDAVKAFETFKRRESDEQYLDTTDGTSNFRSSSYTEVRESLYRSSSSVEVPSPSEQLDSSFTRSSFIRPGRFLVRISEETVKTVRQIYEELIQETVTRRKRDHVERTDENEFETERNSQSLDPEGINNCTIHKVYQKHGLGIAVTGKKSVNDVITPSQAAHQEGALPNGNAATENHVNGSIPGGKNRLRHNMTPKERFRKAGFAVIHYLKNKPRQMDQRDFSKLWRKRGETSWLAIIFTVVAMGTFFADIGTDFKVAADHFYAGDNSWGSLTVCLVIIPSVIINLVSFLWYVEDEEKTHREPRSGWRNIFITHLLQLGILERYWHILKQSLDIKRKKRTQVVDHKILIAINLDMSMLQMILAFIEDAPQLVLQLYVLIRRHYLVNLEAASLRDLWTIISICFSFFSYSRAVVNYISWLRNSKRHKGQLRWYGYLSMWLWRSLMFVSRMLVLVFFATEFKLWFFLVLGMHFFIILAFLSRQEVYFFVGHRWTQHFFRVIIAYIHIFCFFCLDPRHTIRWAIIYYTMTFIENCIFSLLWYTNDERLLPFTVELSGLVVIYVMFVFSLSMMTMYYKVLHPKFKRPRLKWIRKPSDDDLEEQGSEDSQRRESGTNFELWI